MDISLLGIDPGTSGCSVVGRDATRQIVVRRRMRHETDMTYAASLASCVVAMKACCGAHHTGRALARQGHVLRLMSPRYVRPYIKAQKNDERDAEAILEPNSGRPFVAADDEQTRHAALAVKRHMLAMSAPRG